MNWIAEITSIITACANILLVIGIFAAFRQVKAAKDSTKAQVLMQLYEEWRDENIYESMSYIHKLRQDWKTNPIDEWDNLAEKWVEEHLGKNPNLYKPSDQKLSDEWIKRRTAAQFIAKMGNMLANNHLTPDDLFGVVPEMGRLLSVLVPIELANQKYWQIYEEERIAEWDCPFGKWEFNILWVEYQKWYKRRGHSYTLKPINFFDKASLEHVKNEKESP